MYGHDVYYNPEKFGLEVVASLEFSNEYYEFDTQVVWKDAEGNLYTARDSGCSCPSPFENYTSVESLDRTNVKTLEADVEAYLKENRTSSYGYGNPDFERDAREFLKDVRASAS